MYRHTFQNLLTLSTLLTLNTVRGSDLDKSNCATFVKDPSSILGESGSETAPNTEFIAPGVQECVSRCCSLGPPCTLGLFISGTIDDETNCLLYNCDPLSSCSIDVWDGVQVFVNKRFLESSDVNTSLSSSQSSSLSLSPSSSLSSSPSSSLSSSTSSIEENSTNTGGGPSTAVAPTPSQVTPIYELPTSSLGSNPDLSNPDLNQDFYDSNDFLDVLEKLLEGNAESSDANRSLSSNTLLATSSLTTSLPPDSISPSILRSNIINTTLFSSDQINDILLTSGSSTATLLLAENSVTPWLLYNSTTILPADGITTTLLPSNTITADLLPYNKNTTASVLSGSSSIFLQPYDGISTTIVNDVSTLTTELASSVSFRLSSPISSTLVLSSSLTYSSSSASLDDVTTSLGVSDAGVPSQVIFVSPTRFEPDSPTSVAPSHHQLHNATRFKDEDGGQESQSGATTAILVTSVTLGSVFLLVVVGVLVVRFWEGYKKRHYSRLDYLVNGMYS